MHDVINKLAIIIKMIEFCESVWLYDCSNLKTKIIFNESFHPKCAQWYKVSQLPAKKNNNGKCAQWYKVSQLSAKKNNNGNGIQ